MVYLNDEVHMRGIINIPLESSNAGLNTLCQGNYILAISHVDFLCVPYT